MSARFIIKITHRFIFTSLLLFTFICATAQVQVNTFAKYYTNGGIGNGVRQTNDNGYIIAGGEDPYNFLAYDVFDVDAGDYLRTGDFFLMKTDIDGVMEWQRTYGSDTTRECIKWIEITDDNGYILVGNRTFEMNVGDPMLDPGADLMDSSDVVLMKTDSLGGVEWSKVYDSGGDDVAWSVQQTSDGGYIIGAFCDTLSVTGFGALGPFVLLIKTDDTGNIVWEQKYDFGLRDGNTKVPFPYVVKEARNGDFIVVGNTFKEYISDVYAFRINSTGTVLWANCYHAPPIFDNDHPGNSGASDVLEASDSSIIIAGFRDSIYLDFFEVNNPYIIKLDKDGTYQDAKLYDYFVHMERTGFSCVQETSDSNLIFTGNSGYGNSGFANILLKTDLNLNRDWARYYEFGAVMLGGSRNVCESNDGGYLMTGRYSMEDVSVIKMDSVGLIDCTIPDTVYEMDIPVRTSSLSPGSFSNGMTVTDWNPSVDTLFEIPVENCTVDCLDSADASITSAGPYSTSDVPVSLLSVDSGGIWSGTGITDSVNGVFDPATAGTGTHQVIYTIPYTCGDADTIQISVAVPMNVHQLGFDGKAYRSFNKLFWNVSEDVLNVLFEVQMSNDGEVFKDIGHVTTGDEMKDQSVHFLDKEPSASAYYRLKIIDERLNIHYSEVIYLDRYALLDKRGFELYPNPAINNTNILLTGQTLEKLEVTLMNAYGQEVLKRIFSGNELSEELRLNLDSLSAGVYVVKVAQEHFTSYQRLTVR